MSATKDLVTPLGDVDRAIECLESPDLGVLNIFMNQMDHQTLEEAMRVLGHLMAVRRRPSIHLVVCGGSALMALNLVARTTKDVDVLAVLETGELRCARPLPAWLLDDAKEVRLELNLPENWLNDGPADESLFRLGLPEGLAERLVLREYGPILRVSYISRYDQIHFKLYAAADQGGRHFTDLKMLLPTKQELRVAARWTFTQDVSDAFRQVVGEVLHALGHGGPDE